MLTWAPPSSQSALMMKMKVGEDEEGHWLMGRMICSFVDGSGKYRVLTRSETYCRLENLSSQLRCDLQHLMDKFSAKYETGPDTISEQEISHSPRPLYAPITFFFVWSSHKKYLNT